MQRFKKKKKKYVCMNSLKEKIIDVLEPTFGEDAESFLERQCNAHLKCDADDLTLDKIPELARWARIGVELVSNHKRANFIKNQIMSISGESSV